MMSEPRRSSRRLSARLGDKEDAPLANGTTNGNEKAKGGQVSTSGGKQGKTGANGMVSSSAATKMKRKQGMCSVLRGTRTAHTKELPILVLLAASNVDEYR